MVEFNSDIEKNLMSMIAEMQANMTREPPIRCELRLFLTPLQIMKVCQTLQQMWDDVSCDHHHQPDIPRGTEGK